MVPSYAYHLLALVSSVTASPLAAWSSNVAESTNGIEGLIITAENTLNGTLPPDNPKIQDNSLRFSLINNYHSELQMCAYVTGLDRNGHVVILTNSGQFCYPDPNGSTIPVPITCETNICIPIKDGSGERTEIVVPDFISSARTWIADGGLHFFVQLNPEGLVSLVQPSFSAPSDPSADVFFGFMEFAYNEDGLFANLSFVDWVSFVLGMRLTLGGGQVQTVQGLEPDALNSICTGLREQTARDGQPWAEMCVTRTSDGKLLRALSPNMYAREHPGAMEGYYTAYVDEVYAKYANEDLIIDTQDDTFGLVPCRTQGGDELVCYGDSIPFPKPNTLDIWSCDSGPFANIGDDLHKRILARMCAAFTRTELLLPGGNVTPALGTSSYYTVDPTSHYSRLVHLYEIDGKGYAFPYDDVRPTGFPDTAGIVSGSNPQLMEIFIGGGMASP